MRALIAAYDSNERIVAEAVHRMPDARGLTAKLTAHIADHGLDLGFTHGKLPVFSLPGDPDAFDGAAARVAHRLSFFAGIWMREQSPRWVRHRERLGDEWLTKIVALEVFTVAEQMGEDHYLSILISEAARQQIPSTIARGEPVNDLGEVFGLARSTGALFTDPATRALIVDPTTTSNQETRKTTP